MSLERISERKMFQMIEQDITTNLREEGERDPLGFSIYAYVMVKNGLETQSTDFLIDWLNAWIDKVSAEGFGKFLDRNVTALLFSYYTLKTAGRLKTEINIEELIENKLPNYIHKNMFFGSLTHSIIILLSLTGLNIDIRGFEIVLEGVLESLRKGTLVNDPKNVVFAATLFERLNLSRELRTLIEVVSDKFVSNDIFFDEKIYLSWVLWRYKSELRTKMPEIISNVKKFVENFLMSIDEEEDDLELASEVYGIGDRKSKHSRILLGIALDLLVMIKKDRIAEIVPQFGEVIQELKSLGWNQVRAELEKAITSFEENKYSDTCNNLRMGLMLFLKELYESLTGEEAPVEKGKTPNIKDLLKPLEAKGLEPEMKGVITSVWSYLSEKAHIEKSGTEPLQEDAVLGSRLAISIVDYLMKRFLATA
ncbi:hypothetical protein [Archaeoglobus sp.]